MRHRVAHRKLNRTASHRNALLRNMAVSLLKYKRIKTTLAKAKELRSFVEPLLTKSIKGDLHNKRIVMRFLKDKEVVKELFSDIVTTIGERKGGYTRIVKLGKRFGDAADLAMVELVDYNAVANERAKALRESKEAKADAKKAKKTEKNEDVEDAKVVEETKS